MSVIDSLVTNRQPGATYGAADMNRVGEAMVYIAERLQSCGYAVTVSPKVDFTVTDFPTPSVFDHYMADLTTLRSVLTLAITAPVTPGVGIAQPYMTYGEANDIEEILLLLEDSIARLSKSYFYSGEIYAGEF